MSETRREALKIIGAISATCAFPFAADELYGQTEHHAAHALVQVQPTGPRYFSEAEGKVISRIADLIVPETETPGAVSAGVPAYIDSVVGANKELQETFRAGLAWLESRAQSAHGQGFLALTEEHQIGLLTPLCDAADAARAGHAGEKFFAAVKALTADGYFTSKAGLMQQLGYQGNTVVAEFPGCTHEH
jgi:gluconate 2-dehydrogenase gamma chain